MVFLAFRFIRTQGGILLAVVPTKRRFENQKRKALALFLKRSELHFETRPLFSFCDLFVLKVGIEPTLPRKLDFESSASTNSAT